MPDEPVQEEKGNEKAVARPATAMSGAGGHAVVIAQPAPASPMLLPKVSRRVVVIASFWGGMGAVLAAIGATLLNFIWPRDVAGFGGVVAVPFTADQLAPGQKRNVVEAKAWLVRLSAEQAERNGGQEGAILALYQKCPHLGCTIPFRDSYSRKDPQNEQTYAGWFLCPCHGSTYSDTGRRVFGPAPRSMDTFALTIDENGRMSIDTGDITPGTPENGSRGVLPPA